jgi:hypothetical protein
MAIDPDAHQAAAFSAIKVAATDIEAIVAPRVSRADSLTLTVE